MSSVNTREVVQTALGIVVGGIMVFTGVMGAEGAGPKPSGLKIRTTDGTYYCPADSETGFFTPAARTSTVLPVDCDTSFSRAAIITGPDGKKVSVPGEGPFNPYRFLNNK